MKERNRKLRSQRGASILLAMLFLEVCMMAGASILMAASSNAGKIRSSKEEQQVYLALSSALKIVTDDLTSVPYYGQFEYREEIITPQEQTLERKSHIFTQQQGKWDCRLKDFFLPNFDALFGEYLKKEPWKPDNPDLEQWEYVVLPEEDARNVLRTLTIVPELEELRGFQVKISVTVQSDYDMNLCAVLAEVPPEYGQVWQFREYEMNAELTPEDTAPHIDDGALTKNSVNESTSMKLRLGWITGAEKNEE